MNEDSLKVDLKNKSLNIDLIKDINDNVNKLQLKDSKSDLCFDLGGNLGLVYGNYVEGCEKKREIVFKIEKKTADDYNEMLQFSSFNEFFNIVLTMEIRKDSEKYNKETRNDYFGQIPLDFIKINAKIEVIKKIDVNYLRFDFNSHFREPFDFIYVPHLRPEANHIMGDHIFRSPVITIQKDNMNFALIPDFSTIGKDRKYKQHLDMDYDDDCRISYGFRNYGSHKHIFFRSRPEDLLKFNPKKKRKFELKFFLKISNDENKETLTKRISNFMWNFWGKDEINRILPQTLPFEDFSTYMVNRFSDPEVHNGWREFRYKGDRCGGLIHRSWSGKFRGIYRTLDMVELETQIQNEPMLKNPRVRAEAYAVAEKPILNPIGGFVSKFKVVGMPKPVVEFWNQSWYLNSRTAYGLKILGKISKNEQYGKMSDSMINLAKNSPEENGLFSSLAYLTNQGVGWIEGTLAFSPFHKYNLVDIALTCFWLLKYSHEFNYRNQEILDKVEKAIDTILKYQLDSGAFPTIIIPEVDRKDGRKFVVDKDTLYETPGSSAIGMALCMLYKITNKQEYLHAAENIVPYLQKEVIPMNKWYDYETFYSCTGTFLLKETELRDKYTTCLPQNNLCIYWTADFLRQLYECTENHDYLDSGKHILNYLTLFQQIWSAPFLSFMGFGGFGCQNNDGEWSDTRQGLFARELLEYYLITDEEMYLERAIAAMKSSYVLLQHERNKQVAPGNFKWSTKKDYGTITENYSHLGYDHRTPGHITVDWGIGTALLAYTSLYNSIGDLCIDLKKFKAYGVNACSVKDICKKEKRISISIEILPEKEELMVRIIKKPENSINSKNADNLEEKFELELINVKNGKKYSRKIGTDMNEIYFKLY